MYVTGVEWADFVVWSASEFVVLRIARDVVFLSKVEITLRRDIGR